MTIAPAPALRALPGPEMRGGHEAQVLGGLGRPDLGWSGALGWAPVTAPSTQSCPPCPRSCPVGAPLSWAGWEAGSALAASGFGSQPGSSSRSQATDPSELRCLHLRTRSNSSFSESLRSVGAMTPAKGFSAEPGHGPWSRTHGHNWGCLLAKVSRLVWSACAGRLLLTVVRGARGSRLADGRRPSGSRCGRGVGWPWARLLPLLGSHL